MWNLALKVHFRTDTLDIVGYNFHPPIGYKKCFGNSSAKNPSTNLSSNLKCVAKGTLGFSFHLCGPMKQRLQPNSEPPTQFCVRRSLKYHKPDHGTILMDYFPFLCLSAGQDLVVILLMETNILLCSKRLNGQTISGFVCLYQMSNS